MKKLVVVVHGIGEQLPGETLENLVGGATGILPLNVDTSVRHFQEKRLGKKNLRIFPCHIHKISGGGIDTILAEVYWADLSPTPNGRFRTVVALLQTILALSNLIRENARSVFSHKILRETIPSLMASVFVGFFASVNALIALGWLMIGIVEIGNNVAQEHLGFEALSQNGEAHFAISLSGLVAIFIGFFWYRRVNERLFQTFNRWLMFLGLFFTTLGILTSILDPNLSIVSNSDWMGLLQRVTDCLDPRELIAEISPPQVPPAVNEGNCNARDWYVLNSFLFLNLSWGLAILGIFTSLVLGTVIWARSDTNPGGTASNKAIFPAIASAQAFLWVTVIPSIWAALADMGGRAGFASGIVQPYLRKGLATLPLVWVYAFCLILFCVYIWRQRLRAIQLNKAPQALILHPKIDTFLRIIGLLMVLSALALLLARAISGDSQFGEFREFLIGLFPVGFTIAVAVAAVFTLSWEKFAMGVGLAHDVTSYFAENPNSQSDDLYPIRNAMHRRFELVFANLTDLFGDREVVVIAHSQGTVIAVEALRNLNLTSKIKKLKLITMGSPYENIYRSYFGSDFSEPTELLTDGWVSEWKNIFRSDDYIGTSIGPFEANWPENIQVDQGGHTRYWTDPNVMPHLQSAIIGS